MDAVEPTGHLQVKPDRSGRGRSWWAYWRDGEGRHGKCFGPAHVKDTGRRTPRGARIWRAGDGPKPSSRHLTPKDAEKLLSDLLAKAPKTATPVCVATLQDACEGWIEEGVAERGLEESTAEGYEAIFARMLREVGGERPVDEFTHTELAAYFRAFRAHRAIGAARVDDERRAGHHVEQVLISSWTAQPAASVAVEVATKQEAVLVADELGGKWKHERPGAYRVTPPGAQRAKRVSRRDAVRLVDDPAWVVDVRETYRWVVLESPAAQTQNKYRDLLNASFDFACRQGWIAENPMDQIGRVSRRADRRRILRREDFYNQDEVETFLEHAPGLFEEAFWLCGFHAGLRLPGEALGLVWGAVDFVAGVIHPYDSWKGDRRGETKTDEFTPIPMTTRLRTVLLSLKARGYRTADDDHVFTREPHGRPAPVKALRDAFRATQEVSGLKRIPMYNTRHSFGTGLARDGVDPRTIQELMRHAHLETTEIYMAYAPKPELAARIDRALSPSATAA